MRITLNDQPHETSAETVHDLVLEALGEVPAAGTAVAINGNVIPRSIWDSTSVDAEARVDILTAVQGG